MKPLITLILALGLAVTSAHAATVAPPETVVLMDLSGSMGASQEGPLKKNLDQLRRLIVTSPKGAKLSVIGIGKRDTELLKVTFPAKAGPRNSFLEQTRQQALRKLDENLAARIERIDRNGTDIVGGLLQVSRRFAETPAAGPRRLVILSDMLDTATFHLTLKQLSAPNSARTFLDKARTAKPAPELTGVEITCYSIFCDTEKLATPQIEAAIGELKRFWTAYLQAVGGTVKEYRTVY